MIKIFLGLTISNLLILLAVFYLGYTSKLQNGTVADYHLLLGTGAGLMTTLSHLAVYMYHMATTRWLAAATDKKGFELDRFVAPALARKKRTLLVVMGTILFAMLTMVAGVGADPKPNPLWPGQVHLIMAIMCVVVNFVAACVEYRLIKAQGRLMDSALELVSD